MTIASDYIPPNSPFLHYIDYLSLLNRQETVVILGDLNARHRIFGHNDNNPIGRNIKTLIDMDKCRHVGPDFPTLLRHNSTTSPDIVLTNNRAFQNIDIRPGPMTPSDHIPMIATITCNPIPIKIKPRHQFHRADWTNFRNSMADIAVPDDRHPRLEDIDNYLDQWTTTIQKATERHIPTIKYRTIPGIKPTEEIRLLQIQYDAAITERTRTGPTIQINRLINDLKRRLADSYRLLQNQTWNDLISRLDIEEDPTKFWKTIKRLKGNDKQKIPYLRDSQNNKTYLATDKERLFRNHWTKIFSNDDSDNMTLTMTT